MSHGADIRRFLVPVSSLVSGADARTTPPPPPVSAPIVIGTSEAFEIRRVVCGVQTERPLTHQLAHDLIKGLGGRLAAVDIVDLKNNTFYAKLLVEQGEDSTPKAIDTRPSDAVALAMRAGCPLRVAESVLAEARDDTGQDELEEGAQDDEPEAGESEN